MVLGGIDFLWNDPPTYNFFSSVWGELALKLPLVIIAFRHINCKVTGCWRFGHPVTGTGYRACRKHHPVMETGKVTPEDIQQAHEEHGNAANS